MDAKSAVDLMESSSEVHFSGFHMDGFEQRKASTEQPTTSDTEMYKQPFVIGVAGGAASGKTTVCDKIIQQLHDQRVVLVNQDSFYNNLTEEELKRVQDYNFDHPDAFDTEQLLDVMDKLKCGESVDIPKYDFKSYKSHVLRRVNPSDVIILEGILVFHDPRVRGLMNMKIFVDTDADVRLARRIRRDTAEKGRDIAAVLDQYSKFVKPAFDDFILPTKKYADIIIPRGGDNHVAIDLIVQHIRTKLGQHDLCKIYPNLYVIHSTFQIRGMHTLIRDAQTTKHDFVFYSDRLIRLVVEHGLGHLPFTEKQVVTPTGSVYTGVDFCKRLCGVSVIRSGESMENALRACCKGIKIGKILIHREGDNGQQLIYEKLPNDISDRHVLLLDPILGTGNSAVQAISLLIRKGVPESNIIFLNLISAPKGVHVVCKCFPRIKIVTSEIEIGLNEDFRVIPGMGEFGDRYFGTDDDNEQVVVPSQ
ncbi:uridine kinase-like protein 3 isoform X2 [Gastrolobium bilobum]|uniref:uridine kinase-like protein 3 isoform X2 n=1 Tax=Gastrolobium bilobum TaxID=150636 RepID=UPI002AAFB075|nr:uridine kinase-like protein 3 isoform X2 [Gastrolobium bilobum]